MAGLVLIGSARLRRRHFKSRSLVNSYRAGAHCDLVTHDVSALFSATKCDPLIMEFRALIQSPIPDCTVCQGSWLTASSDVLMQLSNSVQGQVSILPPLWLRGGGDGGFPRASGL